MDLSRDNCLVVKSGWDQNGIQNCTTGILEDRTRTPVQALDIKNRTWYGSTYSATTPAVGLKEGTAATLKGPWIRNLYIYSEGAATSKYHPPRPPGGCTTYPCVTAAALHCLQPVEGKRSETRPRSLLGSDAIPKILLYVVAPRIRQHECGSFAPAIFSCPLMFEFWPN